MYILKQLPEDFLVTEISILPLEKAGNYSYYRLIKKNWNTLDAIQRIANILGIKEKELGFAGSKDKHAITEQYISIHTIARERVEGLKIPGLELHFVGYGKQPISLGDLEQNHFEIVVRNVDYWQKESLEYIPNYFDEQRFGDNNLIIGKCLVKKQFKEAVALLHLPLQQPHDYIGALKRLPLRLLRLYLNSYQSYLWNETAARYLRQKTVIKEVPYSAGTLVFSKEILPTKIPLIGFSQLECEPAIQQLLHSIMKKEEITYQDFIIKQIPELTLEGELRALFAAVVDFRIHTITADELFLGKQKVHLSFTLGKGSYATIVMKRLFA